MTLDSLPSYTYCTACKKRPDPLPLLDRPLVDPETGIPLGPAVELSVSPELARELAFRLSLAAMKVEERSR